jgi:hypothetical protein
MLNRSSVNGRMSRAFLEFACGSVAGALRFAEAPDGRLACCDDLEKTSPALN